MTQYIHVRNWDRYQHPDVTRGKQTAAPWIKDHTAQLDDDDYRALTLAERGLLHSIRQAYARRRTRGLPRTTLELSRIIGARVREEQLESLYHAGFLVLSASRTQAGCLQDSPLDGDVDGDKYLRAPRANAETADDDAEPAAVDAEHEPERVEAEPDADADIVIPPASSSSADRRPTPSRPRDELWDELERVFGAIPAGAERTSAHGARNRAVADLRALGATVESIRYVLEAARRQDKPLHVSTDLALAKHYPALSVGYQRRQARANVAFCEYCGGRGGLHLADCTRPEKLADFLDAATTPPGAADGGAA